jgi:SAM-dependent methyltransferase
MVKIVNIRSERSRRRGRFHRARSAPLRTILRLGMASSTYSPAVNQTVRSLVRRPLLAVRGAVGHAGALIVPAGEADDYSFEDARTYWGNVPRAEGGNPLNSAELASLTDEELLSVVDREVEIARQKRERRLGFDLAEKSLVGVVAPRVLDYGSGIGFYGFEVLTRRPDAHLTFADINPDNLAAIRRLRDLRGLTDRVETVLVTTPDATNLSFDAEFDLMMSMGVLHHTPHARAIVRHLAGFLAPGGVFEVMLYNEAYLRREERAAGRKLNAATFGARTDPRVGDMANPFSEPYDRERAIDLFEGFELVSFDQPEPEYDMYRFRKPSVPSAGLPAADA